MPTVSARDFLDALRTLGLADAAAVAELESRPEVEWGDTDALAGIARERGWLTPYQAAALLDGRGSDLAVGGYRVFDSHGDRLKALHPAVAQPVSLRLIRDDWFAPADTAGDFVARSHAAGSVQHPHVATVFDAGDHDGAVYVAQELVDGCELFPLVNEMGAMPVGLAAEYVRQAAMAVQSAHAAGVHHGDVSPYTLLLTPVKRVMGSDGRESVRPRAEATVKLIDLGQSPRRPPLGEITYEQSDKLGRVAFLPPERWRQGGHDAPGDVYGLGATLYFLLTTRPPHVGDSDLAVLSSLQVADPTPVEELRSDVPPSLAGLVRRMLARDPSDRPSVADVVDNLLPHIEASAMPTPPPVVTSETFTLPGVPTAVPVARNLDAPLPDEPLADEIPPFGDEPLVEPLDDHHHDDGHEQAFSAGALGGDTPRAPRPRTQATAKNKLWLVVGICLHLTATTLFLGFLYPGFFRKSADTEQTEKAAPKVKPKKDKRN